jgi:hypothetical protein
MKEAFTSPVSKKHQYITNKIDEIKMQSSLYMPLEKEETKNDKFK